MLKLQTAQPLQCEICWGWAVWSGLLFQKLKTSVCFTPCYRCMRILCYLVLMAFFHMIKRRPCPEELGHKRMLFSGIFVQIKETFPCQSRGSTGKMPFVLLLDVSSTRSLTRKIALVMRKYGKTRNSWINISAQTSTRKYSSQSICPARVLAFNSTQFHVLPG